MAEREGGKAGGRKVEGQKVLLLGEGDARGAIAQFQRALNRTPRRAASLFGLASAAAVAGDVAQSARAARGFLDVWRRADPGRSEVNDARALLK